MTAGSYHDHHLTDMLATRGCKFGYADELPVAVQDKNMEVLVCLLSEDLKDFGKILC